MATSPTPITPLPTPVPQRSDPANFAARGDALLTALPGLVAETNAAGVLTYNNTVEAANSANNATLAAASAIDASTKALAASNFKGIWGDLTGALNKPASVKHNGSFWLLLNNLADITLSEPGVSANWTTSSSDNITQDIVSPGTINMVAGVLYVVKVAGVTLVAPSVLLNGASLRASGAFAGTFLVDWNGFTVKNDPQLVPMSIPAYRGFEVNYDGSTLA